MWIKIFLPSLVGETGWNRKVNAQNPCTRRKIWIYRRYYLYNIWEGIIIILDIYQYQAIDLLSSSFHSIPFLSVLFPSPSRSIILIPLILSISNIYMDLISISRRVCTKWRGCCPSVCGNQPNDSWTRIHSAFIPQPSTYIHIKISQQPHHSLSSLSQIRLANRSIWFQLCYSFPICKNGIWRYGNQQSRVQDTRGTTENQIYGVYVEK